MAMGSQKQPSPSDSTIIRIIDTIKKSHNDSWNYRGLELSNEMLVVLISHPSIDKAAAALDVTIGSLADPKDAPGIAHFLEHMLFMGSSKYPVENEYAKFIKGNGGYSNAYTDEHHTNYYFDINPSVLPDALDIFAQFFISPLFDTSSVDRELEAINSEYEGYLFQDIWRIFQLTKSTSDPEHPYSRFSIGNTESLRTIPKQLGIDIRQVLLDFYQAEYSSNRMSLAVLGNQSLDELQSIVVKSFKDVQNKMLIQAKYPSDPYSETKRKTICYYVPIKEHRRLSINWVIPDHKEFYYCNPESYLSYLIRHEGNGSLLSYLKKFGLAVQLSSSGKNSKSGFNFFYINIELTIEGLHQWKRVILCVYQYLAMLRKQGPKQWIFNERKNINELHFQFRGKEQPTDFVSNLAARMRDYPLSECFSGVYEMREFRPDLINELLNEYLIPSRMRIFLSSKDFQTIVTEKERWYGTQYKLEYLSEEFIKQCETCEINPELDLPIPNEFIPTDFQLFSKEICVTQSQIPIKIKENEYYRLYYAQDSFYKLPKAYLLFQFQNPLVRADPINFNMNELYIKLVEDSLTEFVYPGELAGLKYRLYPLSDGIQLVVYGYNHKIKELLNEVVDRMINIKIETQRFDIIKEKYKQSLENYHRGIPYEMAGAGIYYLINECQWNSNELLSCIHDIKKDDIESFISIIYNRFYIDSLMYGNLTKDQSIELMNLVEKKFQEKSFYQPLYPSMWFNQRQLILPDGCNYAYKMLNDAHKMNAIIIYFQCFEQTLENNALLKLFCHLVEEPFFNQLRTKEQLGYVVNSYEWRTFSEQGFQVRVQSSHKLEYVNKRIELFIHSIRDYILTMSDELFKKQRQGCIVKRLEIAKNMESQTNKFWCEIYKHHFCFDRPHLESEIIKRLERDDLIRFYDYYISPHSIHRRKLSVHVNPSSSLQTNDFNTIQSNDNKLEINTAAEINHETIQDNVLDKQQIDLPEFEWIDNVHIWKSKLACYPLAQSYEEVNVPVLYKL